MLVLFCLIASSLFKANSAFQCPESWGNFSGPSNSNCHQYYACSNWQATLQQCPSGFAFHDFPSLRRCVLEDSVDCGKAPFYCPSSNEDFLDPKDCHRYYQCLDSAPLHRRCPNGQTFFDENKRCDNGISPQCASNGGVFTCPVANGDFEDSSDPTCTHYLACRNGQASRESCQDNFRFHPHPNARRCLLPDSVDCKSPNPFACPGTEADYPDPKDCSRYYSCQNWVPLHRSCEANMIFSGERKTCVPGDPSRCTQGGPSNFQCPQQEGKFPDESDNTCQRYYTCIGGGAQPENCGSGLRFHPVARKCVIESSYDCRDPNGPFQCPVQNGDVRDPYNCLRFYSCQEGAALRRFCDPGTSFSELLKRCTASSGCSDFFCPSTNGDYADPNDKECRSYFQCSGGTRKWTLCQGDFRFHPGMKRCLIGDSVDCNMPQFVCPIQDGDVPDPGNSHRFYSCQSGFPLHRTCPGTQNFNAALKRCA